MSYSCAADILIHHIQSQQMWTSASHKNENVIPAEAGIQYMPRSAR